MAGAAGSHSFWYSKGREPMASVKGCGRRLSVMIMMVRSRKIGERRTASGWSGQDFLQKYLPTVRQDGIELSVSGLTGVPPSICRDWPMYHIYVF